MMLNMSNQYERYRHCNQKESSNSNNSNSSTNNNTNNNNNNNSGSNINSNQLPTTSIIGLGPGSSSGSGICSSPISPNAERESIHSGQFMVSHFEAEEAQDDDDSEIKMLDPEDPSLSKPDEPNVCTEVQLYVPRKIYRDQMDDGSPSLVTSHLEIETSLTKLFKCMNLAYSQKLTSPKWNHFKGVRLRWKDKIRLNNVIWRCWHMQFILKRRTPVCQFASPLDADVHSNPQSVVLEGKYWKRQLAVIKAEYRKWRRNFKNTSAGYLIHDTKSEFDFLEWSPLNDKNLMLTEDWTSDTLFSAINVPFPFPDPREIARGAGIADFIQPSLGPLQPNLDDIDLTFVELLQNSRLPPVPEEGTDDMLKTVEYSFPAIMGPEQMDSSNIMDVTSVNSTDISQSLVNGEDTNMIELNPSLNSMQFTDLEQQFVTRETTNIAVNSSDALMSDQQTLNLLPGSPTKRNQMKQFPVASIDGTNSQLCGFSTGKSVIKGRVSKSNQRPFRREPHNYDKAQPTLHQTNIYQQMLAEQQQQQQQHQLNTIQQHLQQQQYQHQNTQLPQSFQQQQQPPNLQQYSQRFTPTPLLNNNNFSTTLTPINLLNLSPSCTNPKTYPISQMQNTTNAISSSISSTQRQQEPASSLMLNVKIEPPSADVLSMFNLSSSQADDFSMMDNANSLYKPYTKKSIVASSCHNVKSSESNQLVAYLQEQQQQQQHLHTQSLPLPLTSPLSPQEQHLQQQIQSAQQSQQQHQMMPKEMFRSNSLPLNVSLQKLDGRLGLDHFAVPKYHMKNNKSRSRSNSIQQHGGQQSNFNSNNNTLQVTQQLQSATSDPMLNSTLAQLLTKHSNLSSGSKKQSSSTSAIASSLNVQSIRPATATSIVLPSAVNVVVSDTLCQPNSSPSSVSTCSPSAPSSAIGAVGYQLSHQTPQSIHQLIPKKSNSLPVPTTPLLLHSPPGNKMMSYPPPSGAIASISNNLSLSPESFHDQDSPLSPTHSLKYPRDTHRRAGHIHAEQKRRYNIKNGFDMLHSLIPQLQQSPNAKLSKAAMLQKGADHIKQLRSERNALKEKMEALRKERDNLNNSLAHLHSMLPANGAPVTRQRTEHVKQLYEQYVRMRTMSNWKFWILGLILEPLLSSYTQCVSSASLDELRRTVFLWVDQHCSLIDLRPAVSNKLRYLSMTTDILSDPPSTLQDEVVKAINNVAGQHPNLSGS